MRFVAILLVLGLCIQAQNPAHAPLDLRSPVQDKNFFLLSALERIPSVTQAISAHPALRQIAGRKQDALTYAANQCGPNAECHANAMRFSSEEIQIVGEALVALYEDKALETKLTGDLRRSGLFYRYHEKSPADLLMQAWLDAAAGINNVIDVYATGKPPRYPLIDSAAFDVKTPLYGRLVHIMSTVLDQERGEQTLFFQPSLRFALVLLESNRRSEAGRHEPLHTGENRAAIARISAIDWKRFPYSVILVPGSGTDRLTWNISPWAKLRMRIAARRYREGKAPFVVVSGGYVHPDQTPFNEALEMKKSLIAEFEIPPEAILVEPHARHTTTNVRNTARLLYRYGIPFDKKILVTTDPYQSRYIEDPEFVQRCERELGYQPSQLVGRISQFDLEILPRIESLQADAMDPLDP